MILEGIVTTLNEDDSVNVAPMGPILDETMQTLLLRPFQTSTTYHNLKRTSCGVLHVTDDVLLLARAAINALDGVLETQPANKIDGVVLASACRWYEFEVTSLDDTDERTRIECRIVHVGRLRDFFGFNRAKHAVIEAAILATRVHLLPADEIRAEFDRLAAPINKTAGPQEREAFTLLSEFVDEHLQNASELRP
ncbi:MAG: DUF447 family protein [Planctomycetaceae bacterium]|nr:DUF447 family protein [Planctomycetaceae bacterium]